MKENRDKKHGKRRNKERQENEERTGGRETIKRNWKRRKENRWRKND